MEIFPGVHRIDVGLGSREFYCYVLRGSEVVLVDTGMPADPQRVILPYMASIGLRPTDLDGVICSHAHADHYFGNYAVKQAAPGAIIMGHRLDKPWLEDAGLYISEEMGAFAGYGEPADAMEVQEFRAMLTPPVEVDRCLEDGEFLDLGEGWRLQVLHTPSHTRGHLALHDLAHRCLIASEAIGGRGMANRDGRIQNPPFYRDVAEQRATIARLKALDIDCLLLAHEPVMRGLEVQEFIAQSEAFINCAEDVYLQALRSARWPLTMTELTDEIMSKLGPYSARVQVNWLTFAHLSDLENRGLVHREPDARPVAWILA